MEIVVRDDVALLRCRCPTTTSTSPKGAFGVWAWPPGPNTWRALQRIAQRGGYAGPVDGVPGPNTYAGLAELLVRSEHD